MNNKRQTVGWIIGAIALILLGAFGSRILDTAFSDFQRPSLPQGVSGTLPNLQPPQLEETPIGGARNTAIVQAVKQVAPAVVGITARVYNRDIFNRKVLVSEGVGSGVIFDERGYIVTNNHVVEDASNNEVVVSFADGSTAPGIVVGRDVQTDLAVVKVDKTGLPVAVFGNSDEVHVGEPAIAIGNPIGLEFQGTVTSGIISAKARTVDVQEQRFPYLQTDAAINPGNSGGALINAEGYVIGINSAKISHEGIEGIGFAIPINQARPILADLINHGYVKRAYMGVFAVDREVAERYGYEMPGDGLAVLRTVDGGPMDKAGISAGDLLLEIDGQPVKTLLKLKEIIDSHQAGDTLEVVYERQGRRGTAKVTLVNVPEEG